MAAQQYVLDGRFALGEMMEQRPYGDFYQCNDQQTNQPGVLFLSQPAALPTPELVARARQEMMAVAQLSPGFLPVIYLNVLPDQRLFFVTPVPPGPTLTARVGQGVLSLPDAITLFERIATALETAAARGVFHRELEPTNVYLDAQGNVYLANFGVARPLAAGVFGNPWFMAPEQVAGADPGLPANVYSFGLMFYYTVTGVPPYADADPGVLMQRHRQDQPVPPSQVRPDLQLPPRLDSILAKAIAKDPQMRYPTYASFLQDLKNLLVPANAESSPVVSLTQPKAAPVKPAASATPATAVSSSSSSSPVVSLTQPKVTPVKPVASATPAAPVSPAMPATAPAADEEESRKVRRRQKGGFRETLWFKKGEEVKEEAPIKAEDLMKVEKGTGTISDKEKSLDERYRDGAEELTAEDRRKFSVRTGQTGVFQAVRVEDLKAAEQKREQVERELARKRKKNQWVMAVVGLLVVTGIAIGGVFAANAYLYKPLFSSAPFENIEKLIKALPPPPKPQYAMVDKPATELIVAGRKAVDSMMLVPSEPAGDGTSAAELIMSAEKKNDPSVADDLKALKEHFVRMGLSRDYLSKHASALEQLTLLADRMVAFWPEQAVAAKFKEVVVAMKRLKKEALPTDIIEALPYYPLPVFCDEPTDTEEKPLFEKFKVLLAQKRIFEPNAEKLCAVSVYLKLKAVSAAVKKPDKAIAKALPALEKDLNDQLKIQLDEAVKASEWKKIRWGLEAVFRMDQQSAQGKEILTKLEGKFPPESLDKVDIGKITLVK